VIERPLRRLRQVGRVEEEVDGAVPGIEDEIHV
jgi:hypothetical protein